MKDAYLVHKRMYLRAIEPEDLEVLYLIENDPQSWDITNFTVPYSKFALKQYIENTQSDIFADRQLRLMIVSSEDDGVVGVIDITDFTPQHLRGEVGIVIRKEHQGKGYASEALDMLCNYAFHYLYMKQLTAHITVGNKKSLQLFTSNGFVECGLLKEWWRAGRCFEDVVLLQRISS